jgi:hypothetical protein
LKPGAPTFRTGACVNEIQEGGTRRQGKKEEKMTSQSMTSQNIAALTEKSWPVVLIEVAAATVACIIMMSLLALTAYGVAGLLG